MDLMSETFYSLVYFDKGKICSSLLLPVFPKECSMPMDELATNLSAGKASNNTPKLNIFFRQEFPKTTVPCSFPSIFILEEIQGAKPNILSRLQLKIKDVLVAAF